MTMSAIAANATYLSLWKGPIPREPKTVDEILEEVSREYKVPISILKGPERYRSASHPRFAAMRRLRDHPMPSGALRSLPAIGRVLGGRDHTTILNGLRRYAELAGIAFDPKEP